MPYVDMGKVVDAYCKNNEGTTFRGQLSENIGTILQGVAQLIQVKEYQVDRESDLSVNMPANKKSISRRDRTGENNNYMPDAATKLVDAIVRNKEKPPFNNLIMNEADTKKILISMFSNISQ